SSSGISDQTGWWNSIAPGDFDNDGDMDYILGNTGQNTFYRVSKNYPAKIYAKDFNNDGNYDAIPSLYLHDEDGKVKEYPAQTRDDLIKQMISMRAKFLTYNSFAKATINDLLSKDDLKDALILQANNMSSCLLKNMGNGKFQMIPLPSQAQLSSLNGMAVGDFDGDHKLDVVISTNDFGTEVSVGRYDALNGLYLKGDGHGNFTAVPMNKSGICIKGNGKAMVMLNRGGRLVLAGSQNRGPLKLFSPNIPLKLVAVEEGDVTAMIKFNDGKMRKQEIDYGGSFLSQSGRFLVLEPGVESVQIINSKGEKRILKKL
ncbi:MAG: FG-GAP repeat domain-containing protein, partial [Flavisolibacter sp.]